VPYLPLGLQDVQWAMGNSRGARKLARTPHVNQKKKRNYIIYIILEKKRNYIIYIILERFFLLEMEVKQW